MTKTFDKIKLKYNLLLHPVKKSNEKISLNNNSKLLILCFDQIEYTFASTSLIKIIKKETGCEIDVLTTPGNDLVFKNNPNVNNIILFSESKNFLNKLNGNKYNILINTQFENNKIIENIILQLDIENKISFRKKNSEFYTHVVNRKKHLHILDEILLLTNPFDFPFTKKEIKIDYNGEISARSFVVDFIIKNKIDTNKPLIGINISSENDNFWGIDRYKKLIKYLSNYDVNVIILRHPIDKEKAEQVYRSNSIIFNNNHYNEFAAIILELDFLFTPDSSAVQIASGKEIPMFILYLNKEMAKRWCPYSSDYECVIADAENYLKLSYGNVLNSFIPFFENFYNKFYDNK